MKRLAVVASIALLPCALACSSSNLASDAEPAGGGFAGVPNSGGAGAGGKGRGGSGQGIAGGAAGHSVVGPGGAPAVLGPQRIGDEFDSIETIELSVNIDDGFFEYNNEWYTVDVATGHVDYEHSNGTLASGDASEAQLSALVTAVRDTVWREQPDCMGLAIDGAPTPPRLTVTGGGREERYGVSDAACAESDHSAFGLVISCDAYRQIHTLLLEVVPAGSPPYCQSYW